MMLVGLLFFVVAKATEEDFTSNQVAVIFGAWGVVFVACFVQGLRVSWRKSHKNAVRIVVATYLSFDQDNVPLKRN